MSHFIHESWNTLKEQRFHTWYNWLNYTLPFYTREIYFASLPNSFEGWLAMAKKKATRSTTTMSTLDDPFVRWTLPRRHVSSTEDFFPEFFIGNSGSFHKSIVFGSLSTHQWRHNHMALASWPTREYWVKWATKSCPSIVNYQSTSLRSCEYIMIIYSHKNEKINKDS